MIWAVVRHPINYWRMRRIIKNFEMIVRVVNGEDR